MKFMIAFVLAMLPVASVAQSQSGTASGVPSIAIPETTAVLVIETPKKGVTAQQIMDVIPAEIRATVDFDEFLGIQQDLLLDIMRAVEGAGTSLAVPLFEGLHIDHMPAGSRQKLSAVS